MAVAVAVAAGSLVSLTEMSGEASSAQLRMGSETTLTADQKNLLDSRWEGGEISGKLICTSLFLSGADFEDRVVARKQAKAACTYLREKTGLEIFFQGKPTDATNMVGAVFIRTHQSEVKPNQEEQQNESDTLSVSKTVALPEMDMSSSATASQEIIDEANKRLSSMGLAMEVVCTAVVGEDWQAEKVALAAKKAKSLCQALATSSNATVRFQTKVSKSSWAGRLMLTTIAEVGGDSPPNRTSEATRSAPVQPPRSNVPQPPRTNPGQETPASSRNPNRPPQEIPSPNEDEDQTVNQQQNPEPEPITVEISGTALPGQSMSAEFSNVPDGATVTCTWHNGADSETRQVMSDTCTVTVPNGSALYFSAMVTQGDSELYRVVAREICDVCSVPAPEAPTLQIVGDRYVGELLRVVVSPLPEGSTVACSWESNGSYNNTIYSSSCNFTPNRQITGAIFVKATATIPGKPNWSSGFVSVGQIVYRPISPAPSLAISGERFVGGTLEANVGTLPPGAALSCTWESRGSFNNTIYGRSCNFALAQRFGDGSLWVRAVVSLPNHADWTSGYVNVGAIGYRQFSPQPELSLTGTLRVGETITATIANQPDGSSVSCNWYTPGYIGPTVHGTSCGLTLTNSLANVANGGQGLFVRVSVSKTGFDSWAVTRQIQNVELLVFNPTFELIGERSVGATLVASVTNIPEGSVVSCLWSRKNRRGANVSAVEYSTACELTITPELKSSINQYSWGMDLQIRVNKPDYPQWSRLISGIFIQ
jgi:hypothetical protein